MVQHNLKVGMESGGLPVRSTHCDGIGQGRWSDMVRHSSRMRRKLGELPIEKKLACALAGVMSPGTWSCADDKGPPRKEVGG
jgi:hypothetical protein